MDNSADKRQTESVILKESRREQAVEAFLGGCNCAQAVFSTYADLFGIDRRTAMNLTNSMGGGISRLREVCGTVSAMALLVGMGRSNFSGRLQATELEEGNRTFSNDVYRGVAWILGNDEYYRSHSADLHFLFLINRDSIGSVDWKT